jgi:hypothetical protein
MDLRLQRKHIMTVNHHKPLAAGPRLTRVCAKGIAELEAQLATSDHPTHPTVTSTESLCLQPSTTDVVKPPPNHPKATKVGIPTTASIALGKKKIQGGGHRKASGRTVVVIPSDPESDSDSERPPIPSLLKYRYQIQEYGTDGFAEGEMRVDADLSEAQNQWRCSGKIPHGYQPNWGYKFAYEPQGKKPINFGNSSDKYKEILKQILQNHEDLHNKVGKTKVLTPLLILDTTTKTAVSGII